MIKYIYGVSELSCIGGIIAIAFSPMNTIPSSGLTQSIVAVLAFLAAGSLWGLFWSLLED